MSSNALTAEQPVEVIKKFQFSAKGEKEEIEIIIPEVSYMMNSKNFSKTNMVLEYNAIVRNA